MIDPQNEVLSETGLGWPLLRESLRENNTVENMERIFKAARKKDNFLVGLFRFQQRAGFYPGVPG
jgi:hypothetical protein